MSMERRLETRVDWQGLAEIHLGLDNWSRVRTTNVSHQGIGLVFSLEIWAEVEEAASVIVRVEQPAKVVAETRVCWSQVLGEEVLVGLEVILFEEGSFDSILQSIWSVEDTGPEFNF